MDQSYRAEVVRGRAAVAVVRRSPVLAAQAVVAAPAARLVAAVAVAATHI